MDIPAVLSAYRRQAPFYDAVFGPLLGPGRRRVVRIANGLPGDTLLEVGVGTGLSLPHYRPNLRIHGIDISPDMLDIARERVERGRLSHVAGLYEMDAELLRFPDDSFDIVAAMYVASVVPNPDKMLAEIKRVCRPHGTVLIVNHFAAQDGLRWWVERNMAPLSRRLGWRPDFALEPFLAGSNLEVIGTETAPPLGLFTILRCVNRK